MAEDDGPNYRDILTENLHTLCKYINAKDFITELMSSRHLSQDDKERISNPYSNQTRREQAQHLVEVLMTKGLAAYTKFLEILEFNYPHVYQEMTKKVPRKPPTGYIRSRYSEKIRLLDDLPEMARNMQSQFKENLTLSKQLEEFQALLELSKSENKDLEVENMGLRDRCSSLQKEVEGVKTQLYEKTEKLEALQDDNTRTLTRMVVTLEELREYKDKQAELLTRNGLLEKQICQLRGEHEASPRNTSSMRERGAPYNGTPPLVPVAPVSPLASTDGAVMERVGHLNERNRLLENKLEEVQEQNEYQGQRIQKLEDEIMELEEQLRSVKSELKRAQRERDVLEREKKNYLQMTNDYFKIIESKEKEKAELEDEKQSITGKLRDANQKNSDLFKTVHELNAQMAELRIEIEKVKARNSFNRDPIGTEIPMDDPSNNRQRKTLQLNDIPGFPDQQKGERPGFNTLPAVTPPNLFTDRTGSERTPPRTNRDSTEAQSGSIVRRQDHNGHTGKKHSARNGDLYLPHVPDELISSDLQRSGTAVQHGDGDSSVETCSSGEMLPRGPGSSDRESEGDETSSTDMQPEFTCHEEYKVLFPTSCCRVTRPGLRKDTNSVIVQQPAFSHIELSGGNHTGIFISRSYLELKEGDQIVQLMYKENDRDVKVICTGKTLNDIRSIFQRDLPVIEVTVRRCYLEYESARKWMVEHNGTGDYFYVRFNRSLMTSIQSGPTSSRNRNEIRTGDVFQVTNSCIDSRNWLGNSIDKITGEKKDKNKYLLPKSCQSAVGAILRFNSLESDDRSKKAFRVRGNVFDRVIPMKAMAKLPVALVGLVCLQDEMLSLLARDSQGEFVPADSAVRQSFSLDQNYHVVRKCFPEKFTASRHVQDIFILLSVRKEGSLSELFGSHFTQDVTEEMIRLCTDIQHKLRDAGKCFEELCLSDLENQQELMSAFKEKVRRSQDCILWLSASEMDPAIAERNISMLGAKTPHT